MSIQIQSRQGSASLWTSNNPTLAVGEIGVESDTLKMKVGNGFTTWTSLPYSNATASLFGTASWASNAISVSVNTNNTNGVLYYPAMSSGSTTSQQSLYIDTLDMVYNQSTATTWLTNVSASTITSSQITTTGITGSIFGTSSWASNTMSASVNATTAGPYYIDLSTGSSGNQPTFIATALTYTNGILAATSSYSTTASWAGALSGAHSGPLTGSVFGTASNAVSSSWAGALSGAHSGPLTGSVFGTASAAVIASTSSFGGGIPLIQSGVTAYSSVATISPTFNKAFPTSAGYGLGIAFSGSTFVSSSRISATATTGFTVQFQTGSGWLLWHAIGNT